MFWESIFCVFLIFSSYLLFFWFTGGQAAPWSFVWTVQSTMQHCSQGSQQPSEWLLTEKIWAVENQLILW
jgi:hypothetical protein